ncbi:serine/threonine-protein kinase [Methylomonas sp. AM2-LC]|uniref:serine/threonine-protein kinase n=1 Tax=Methylomonas sp. AM2-LC TaxID=3153301 RepID=UPI0032635DCE
MTSFDKALQAFHQSQISFIELIALLKKTGIAAPEVDILHNLLKNEHQAGKLSDETYANLKAELSDTHPSDFDLDKTQILIETTNYDTDATQLLPPLTGSESNLPPPSLTSMPMHTESLLTGLSQGQGLSELKVGATLNNRFVLQELLGVGGMGLVFKAVDLRKIEAADKEPFVALKVLNQDFQTDPMALIALQRETKRAQTLAHPNIIKVYDFDRDGGHVFMTMEYLQGRPLSHLIKEHDVNGLSYKQAWPIIHAMADALAYAHKKNIVHSDFKPGNVFIDESNEVRVLDFGIACAIGRSDKDHQDATVFNARSLGAMTPAYASLEQLRFSEPDQRDDIYALACVSYELLTGKHPFGRLSAEKALEVNLQVKPISKLSHRQWKCLQKALAFQQEQRTSNINEFLTGLGPRSALFYGLWGAGILSIGLLGGNIYQSFLAPPTVIEAPIIAAPLTPEQQQKIKDFLELASIHTDVGYLTAPTGSNALWAYQEVLKIDPYNQQAKDGMLKIADLLEQQAWEAYEKNDRATALKKVQEGLEAYSSHKGLLSLQEKLRTIP